MPAEKPILIHHADRWRPYRGTRSLLECISIGDVIPVVPDPIAEEPAKVYLHSRTDARADLLSVETPTDEHWRLVSVLVEQQLDTFDYPDPFE